MIDRDTETATAQVKGRGRFAFTFILVTVFIDMLAFAVVMPVMPEVLSEVMGKPIAEVTPAAGWLAGLYAVLNFLVQPVLGNLSDRFGRRPVLLVSMGCLSLDFLIIAFAQDFWMLLLGRVLTGVSGATHATAAAYVADVTEPAQRAHAYGLVGAAFGLGFVVGPLAGGLLSEWVDSRAPFFVAAALAAINCFYGLFMLPESLPRARRRRFDWSRASPFGAFAHFSSLPRVGWFILALGLYNAAFWVYPATFSFYGKIRFDWSDATTGLALTVLALGMAIVQATLAGPAVRKLGDRLTLILALCCAAATLLILAGASAPWMVFLAAPLGALGTLFNPGVNHALTCRVGEDSQGELQGALFGVQALGNVFAPVAFTQVLFAFTGPGASIHFPGAAFLLAGLVTLLALAPVLVGFRVSRCAP